MFFSYVEILCNTGGIFKKKQTKKKNEQGHVQRQRAHARCWRHFLSALFSAALVGYDGAKHDKSTAAGVAAECGAEVPVVPDINTNLQKCDKRRGKQDERVKPKHPGG